MSRGAVEASGEIATSPGGDASEDRPRSAIALLGSQVMLDGVRLGTVGDVLFGADLGVVLGLQVATDTGRTCFLPWAGALPANGCVFVSSPTLLLGEVELEYYVASGVRLSDVVDADLGEDGREVLLRDLTFVRDGSTRNVVVASGNRRSQSVSVGDLRVHWSAGQARRLALTKPRHARRSAVAGELALTVRGRAA